MVKQVHLTLNLSSEIGKGRSSLICNDLIGFLRERIRDGTTRVATNYGVNVGGGGTLRVALPRNGDRRL